MNHNRKPAPANFRLLAPTYQRRFQAILGMVRFKGSILDLGCADGYYSKAIAGQEASVVGVDIDSDFLDKKSAFLQAQSISQYGQGRVAYFAASVDKRMFFYPDTYMRQMLANAARWAARDVPPGQ